MDKDEGSRQDDFADLKRRFRDLIDRSHRARERSRELIKRSHNQRGDT
jgi:hypothetical protein